MDKEQLKSGIRVAYAKGEGLADVALAAAIRSPWTLAGFVVWTVAAVLFGVWVGK